MSDSPVIPRHLQSTIIHQTSIWAWTLLWHDTTCATMTPREVGRRHEWRGQCGPQDQRQVLGNGSYEIGDGIGGNWKWETRDVRWELGDVQAMFMLCHVQAIYMPRVKVKLMSGSDICIDIRQWHHITSATLAPKVGRKRRTRMAVRTSGWSSMQGKIWKGRYDVNIISSPHHMHVMLCHVNIMFMSGVEFKGWKWEIWDGRGERSPCHDMRCPCHDMTNERW